MGMDVYGLAPTSTTGEYFRRNVWGWHPLATLIEDLAPQEAAACSLWHTNDGDGLDASGAKALARRLQHLIADGTAAAYIAKRDANLAALPDKPCSTCEGTGIRLDEIGAKRAMAGMIIGQDTRASSSHPRLGQTDWCNACNGTGRIEPPQRAYYLSLEDVTAFVAFLHESGGFQIC